MSQTIRRPVGEVFDTAVRLDQFPPWSPRNSSAKKLTSGEIGEGTRFEMGIKGFGKITNELREFEPNKRVMVVPLTRMLTGGHRWLFTDVGTGETRIDHELELEPRGLFKLMNPMLRANGKGTVEETAGALKQYLDSGPAAPPPRSRRP
jgi:uncharacterized protein YndB with AHSA1/START domain